MLPLAHRDSLDGSMNLLMFMCYSLLLSWLVYDGTIASVGGDILQADVVAGLTVGLMVVPQSLAYAKSIAGLPIRVRKCNWVCLFVPVNASKTRIPGAMPVVLE
jgi:hypothetical protein